MKFFIDSADLEIIRDTYATGLVDGVTTNPSLIAKSGRDLRKTISEIAEIAAGTPVSAEVIATDYPTMMEQAHVLSRLAPNVVIKLPMTADGLRACRALYAIDVPVNVTLVFSVAQAILAAKCGATFVSPFVGRLDDYGTEGDGMRLIEDIVTAYTNYDFATEVLVASVRSLKHIEEAAIIGADVATIPPKFFAEMNQHPLTDKGLAAFLEDWNSTNSQF